TAEAIFGDQMMTNTFMLGVAYQAGRLPVAGASVEAAIELNGVAVDRNLQAFRYGRLYQHDPAAVRELLGGPERSYPEGGPRYVAQRKGDGRLYEELLDRTEGLDTRRRRMLATGGGELIQSQNPPSARRYLDAVLAIHSREHEVRPGRDD